MRITKTIWAMIAISWIFFIAMLYNGLTGNMKAVDICATLFMASCALTAIYSGLSALIFKKQ